jgi:hypothetical protein
MALSLNKCFGFLFLLFAGFSFAQTDADDVFRPKDYKEQDQFKHFFKRREVVGKWQILQLKNGAVVVRLHNNKKLIDQLKKRGQADLALQKEHESFALNKNISRAFIKHFTFAKVYFIYSNSSDSLLRGTRSGIFLDSNLIVDPKIEMTEKFYLIGERDVIYNSTIGFVKEDTARFVKESGAPSKEMGIILKNKYGHQLKDPIPYYVVAKGSNSSRVIAYYNYYGTTIKVEMAKRYSFEKYELYVLELNYNLKKFYEQNKNYEVKDPDVVPYLY